MIYTAYMRKLITKLEEKGLGDLTIKRYMGTLYNLNGGQKFSSLVFLRNTDEVIKTMKEKYNLVSQKTMCGCLMSVLSVDNVRANKKAYVEYSKLMSGELNPEYNKTKGDMTEKQKENWLSREEIEEVRDRYRKEAEGIVKKGLMDYGKHNYLLDNMIVSMYTNMNPRRAKDYACMKYGEPEDQTEGNWFDGKDFIFNEYKAKAHHGTQRIRVDKEVMKDLDMYMKMTNPTKGDLLIKTASGRGLSLTNGMTRRLNNIFGKNVSVNMLRNMHFTHKFGDMKKELANDSYEMGTGTDNALSIYTK